MELTADILLTSDAACSRCYHCVRKCPVKAINLTATELKIDPARCIYCGACVSACSRNAITPGDGPAAVKEAMASRQVVALVAPEIDVVFPEVGRARIDTALRLFGFYGVEEMVVADELVAAAYADLLSRDTDRPVIRSTCPAAVNYIEMYHPELVRFLAPIASPMIVQGRLIKRLYGNEPVVVFIGPCIAKKAEILRSGAGAVDIAITFAEMTEMMDAAGIKPDELPVDESTDLIMARKLSAPGGFPLSLIGAGVGSVAVSHGIATASEALIDFGSALDGRRFFDLLSCRGCIDGPAFDSGNRWTRLALINRRRVEPEMRLAIEDILESTQIDLTQTFGPRPVEETSVSRENIREVLALAGFNDPARRLDCTVCGYSTCVKHAEAVVLGRSDWSACFMRQKEAFNETTARLREASNTDSLTGLVNHRGFVDMLAVELQRHVRYGSPLSLIMIDLDNFKQINDTYGHLQGDNLLKLLAQVLKRNLRETDIVARYGGDEFTIIVPELNKAEAFAVAEKLRDKVEATTFWLGEEIKETLTLSLGVCDAVAGDDPMTMLSCADKALYRAKKSGRNQTAAS